ncbi:stabilizer of axonemal microtubules 2-like [Stegodyphus dumicola]|uniref:stabilizer of axonemal microtubules 2-like n=1 Tax=Stegodyphus dumicola TaxID=202533 RepID=UPI0015AC338D|nr:stabilizer of axonemal microtubules 2-like [Stegodyphus dumicola]
MRPKIIKEAKGKMVCSTTYKHDYGVKKAVPTSKIKGVESRKDGTMPGTLPGKIEGVTTYGRSYTPKPTQRRQPVTGKECTLTKLGQEFRGETETALCYKAPPHLKRDKILPKKGELKFGGEFRGETTHKTDYTPKYQLPVKPFKKTPKWQPGTGKFESETTHAHDYKYPLHAEKPIKITPKPAEQRFEGDFQGVSHYKVDYPAHHVVPRKIPEWHPLFRSYKLSDKPFIGKTTYRTDYEPPPEDIPVQRTSRAQRGNLTLPTGPMEKMTTAMRDYQKVDCPIPTKSFKPVIQYEKPKEKFADCSITKADYTPKIGEKTKTSKVADNLKVEGGPMDDLSMTMKDFQWLALECPATYIKLYGKEALPDYVFDKTEGGHDYFKKLKKAKPPKSSI